ncbi:MAG: CsbD family protein [Planctomycetaceae bacterium]
MNADTIAGNWKQLKGKVKERWARLTDDDLRFIEGKKDQLVGKLQERYGYAREQAQKEADEFYQNCNC